MRRRMFYATCWSPDVYVKMMQMGQSYLFPALMGAYEDPYFSEDRWNRQVVENVVPIMRDESWPATPAPWTSMWLTWAGRACSRVILDGLSGGRGDEGSPRYRGASQGRFPERLRQQANNGRWPAQCPATGCSPQSGT